MSTAASPAPPAQPTPTRPVAFVDSSAIVALVDRDDASHTAVVAAYRDLLSAGYRLFTTNHVVVETYDLLNIGVGQSVARRWLHDTKLAVYHADQADEEQARRLMVRRNSTPPQSLTDAISRVVMKRLGVADAFVVDPRVLEEES